jgi:AraC-like DNA-binding protein
LRLGNGHVEIPAGGHAHSHDFLVLTYFEHGSGQIRVGGRELLVEAGDVLILSPGVVVGIGEEHGGMDTAEAWNVFFTAEAIDSEAHGSNLAWRAHPLLLPFVGGATGGAQRLRVAASDRDTWEQRLRALDNELRQRRTGYQEAALALLTLLLVEVGRLATDVGAGFRLNQEPLLADVFDFIEQHFHEHTSLRDVAWAVNLTPGHLTTVVRCKTGRPVQEWITERRMAESRQLLAGTTLGVEEIGLQVGYDDPGYFTRIFRRTHGVAPLAWRKSVSAI